MNVRVYNTEAVVLHRINLGEHDKILTLYTRDRGKLSAVAKGARKPLSKLAGASDLFTLSRMQLAVGRSLDVVTQAETLEPFRRLRADLTAIAYASVMTELIDRFLEERAPHPELFVLLVESLRALERQSPPDMVMHLFALHLLVDLGYRPRLESCAAGGEALGEDVLFYSPSLGGVVCAAHRRQYPDALRVRPDTVALAGALLRIGPADAEALATLDAHAGPEIRRELERILRAQLQYHLERPIRSLDFVHEVQAMYTTEPQPNR